MEFFDEQKDCEGHEDLPSGPGHECEEIEEPISPTKYHLFVLRDNIDVRGVPDESPDRGRGDDPADDQIGLRKIKEPSDHVDKDADCDAGCRGDAPKFSEYPG